MEPLFVFRSARRRAASAGRAVLGATIEVPIREGSQGAARTSGARGASGVAAPARRGMVAPRVLDQEVSVLRSILVPLDGSELAERILEHLGRILLKEDVEVVLLRVVEPGDLAAERTEQAQAYLKRIERIVAGEGPQVVTILRRGDPAAEIVTLATERRPSLVVMATHGRSGPLRWLRGSVAERVLRSCPVPLLLSNPRGFDDPDPGFPRIVVPFDGSERSGAILPLVEAFARTYESLVTLLHVASEATPLPMGAPTVATGIIPTDEEAEEVLAPAVKFLRRAGVEVEPQVARGDPADEVLAAAEEASLVMMTTHGRSGMDRWLFGSVAEKVLRSCTRPLVVLRAGELSPPGEARETLQAEGS